MADVDELQRSLALAKTSLVAPVGARTRVWDRLGPLAQPAARSAASNPAVSGNAALQKAGVQPSPSTPARVVLSGFTRVRAWTLALMGISFIAGYWLGGTRTGPVSQAPLPQNEGPGAAQPPAASRERWEAARESMALEGAAPTEAAAPVGRESTELDEPRSGGSRQVRQARNGASRPARAAGDMPAANLRSALRVPPRADELERPAADGPVSAASADGPVQADSLAREVALLQRVERAIRAGEGQLALTLLDQHERDYPESSLREERTAARVLAACVQGSDASAKERARATAEHFLAVRTLSVYAARIRTLCALDSGAEPEKDSRPGH